MSNVKASTYKVMSEDGRIQPFYTINPFIIFQMTPTLNIDKDLLDQHYFAFQRMLHPDKLRHISDELQQRAEQHIGQINQAYKALQNVLQIAKATVLYIQDPSKGIESFNDHDIPMLDVEFLNTIMTLQNQSSQKDADELYYKVIAELDVAIQELNLQTLLNAIARLTYIERLRNLTQGN